MSLAHMSLIKPIALRTIVIESTHKFVVGDVVTLNASPASSHIHAQKRTLFIIRLHFAFRTVRAHYFIEQIGKTRGARTIVITAP